MIEDKERIYCIEGHWDYESDIEPSVEPILQAIRSMGHWDYARRDCATPSEMKYWLDKEWAPHCARGSILYLATHGSAGVMSLSDHSEGDVSMEQFLAWDIDVQNCLVHFGGCHGLDLDEDRIRRFLNDTKASAVSGYQKEGGWTDSAPTLALELMYFASISERGIDINNANSAKRLRTLEEDLQERFGDCEFVLHTRWN